ncbi:dj-1/pfpi [Lucifera butyrica]|uniref:Dj-1/pfpi n=1 Tax=Lucifera butyrica TaxID=1351585 RepID=A0A498R4D1_9FIRM|nr:DJ-1/PfpI family protein [Lucifera butyrica]VBB05687.1 dj-1/pfpi [Lucifera butyrica]
MTTVCRQPRPPDTFYVSSELNAPETGYAIKTLSLDLEPKTSMGGFRVLPDYSVADFPADFGMLILIGGYAWMKQLNNAVLPVVDYAIKKGIPVGAICNAANFMAENGYLDQIRHSGNTPEFMQEQLLIIEAISTL